MDLPDFVVNGLLEGDKYIVKSNTKNLLQYCEENCEILAHILYKGGNGLIE